MSKYKVKRITQLSANENAAIKQINDNLDNISELFDDTVSRSAKLPSAMTAPLDMNGQKLINLGEPSGDSDAVRYKDIKDLPSLRDETVRAKNEALDAKDAALAVVSYVEGEGRRLIEEEVSLAKAWATADDFDERLEGESSSKRYANLAMAIANAEEDVPVSMSQIQSEVIIRGPQGEQGPQGPQGIQGIQGIQGVQGVQGPVGNLPVGSIFFSIRTDIPVGSLPCSGGVYSGSTTEYRDFYEKYLLTGKIPSLSMSDYTSEIAQNNTCGFFGLDRDTRTFKTPTLRDFVRATTESSESGSFQGDTIRNVTGSFMTACQDPQAEGVFEAELGGVRDSDSGGNSGYRYRMDLSKQVPTSSEVRPRNIKYRAFVSIYTGISSDEVQAEQFITEVETVRGSVGDINNILDEINGEVL